MSDYGWVITRDFIGGDDKGVSGPSGISDSILERLKDGEGARFRMCDDDGAVYYHGRIIGDSAGLQGFAPLDDFGTPNAGCSYIEYKSDLGGWEML